jgi:hypothetical protein
VKPRTEGVDFDEACRVLVAEGYLPEPRRPAPVGITTWRPDEPRRHRAAGCPGDGCSGCAGRWWHYAVMGCPGHDDRGPCTASPDPVPASRPGLDDRLRELGVDPKAWRARWGARLLS